MNVTIVLKFVTALLEYFDDSKGPGPLNNMRRGFSPLAPLSAAYEYTINFLISILIWKVLWTIF